MTIYLDYVYEVKNQDIAVNSFELPLNISRKKYIKLFR